MTQLIYSHDGITFEGCVAAPSGDKRPGALVAPDFMVMSSFTPPRAQDMAELYIRSRIQLRAQILLKGMH